MRIVVISDTHIPFAEKKLPSVLEEEIRRSDYCFHAGDFVSYDFFKTLKNLTKFFGVCGNMDEAMILKELPPKQIIEIENFRIGLIHGKGAPNNLLAYIKDEFLKDFDTIDIFVFGHSHFPVDKEIDGKIYFNPGSPTDKVFAPYSSYGILEIEDGVIKRKIIKL